MTYPPGWSLESIKDRMTHLETQVSKLRQSVAELRGQMWMTCAAIVLQVTAFAVLAAAVVLR